jgi:predicted transcriptional regulator
MPRTTQVNTRVDTDMAAQLDKLASLTGRTRSTLLYTALQEYLENEMAFLEAVEEGIAAARAGDLTDHAEVVADMQRRRVARHTQP